MRDGSEATAYRSDLTRAIKRLARDSSNAAVFRYLLGGLWEM